mmetsp:Transcript_48501/g.58725  ORF Transcript_48501/g.58725 Transcript_48501/m.58725 type:complete len:447 (+) Transcript_48501:183-1523(+)
MPSQSIMSQRRILSFLLMSQSCSPFSFIPHGRISIRHRTFEKRISLYSSIGGGRDDRPPNDGDNKSPLGDFFSNDGDKDDVSNRRKKRADARLPLNFRSDDGSRDEEFFLNDVDEDENEENDDESLRSNEGALNTSSALERIQSGASLDENSSLTKNLSRNPYLEVVSRLTPSEMILRFTSTANPQVQDAVKTTILGLVGNLPSAAFETTVVTSGARLASLMFQLQMTGYMFKNAEYRMALSQPSSSTMKSQLLLKGDVASSNEEEDDMDDNEGGEARDETRVRGKINVNYPSPSSSPLSVEVDADAYLAELRAEVRNLRKELSETRESKMESIRKDLLVYIRTLPPQELKQLTATLSEDVLDAMKGLVNNVMAGIVEGEGENVVGPDTVMEQSGEAMAQLCMWQLVVGYNMRELEVREEMKQALLNGATDSGTEKDGHDSEEADK